MTITLEVPEDLATHLKAAGIAPEDASRYVISGLVEIAARIETDAAEVRAWWDRLSPDEQENERELLRSRVREADSGKSSPASEVYARIRARFGSVPAA